MQTNKRLLQALILGLLSSKCALAEGDANEEVIADFGGEGMPPMMQHPMGAPPPPREEAPEQIENKIESQVVSAPKAFFWEQFTNNPEKRWIPSKEKRESDVKVEAETSEEEDEKLNVYGGHWKFAEPELYSAAKDDIHMIMEDEAAFHAISHDFAKPFDANGEDFVIQYEVKLQKKVNCAGEYLKLLAEPAKGHMSNKIRYSIMFGPDVCGMTNKVHFIMNVKNPITGEYEEKHLSASPSTGLQLGRTKLYTLIIRKDDTYEILIDNQSVKKGKLLEAFVPSLEPPMEIPDPEDKKPEDWVDSPKMLDETAVKPDDWDEDAPMYITDPEATMPEDWLENEEELISDPDATKPLEWDDSLDGEWTAPLINNPKCATASGCGAWVAPEIRNPEYKGKWNPPVIDNPAYKGPWKARLIPNPNHYTVEKPSKFDPIHALGFELWTMHSLISFDNIYLGTSVEEANEIAEKTFIPKKKVEDEHFAKYEVKAPEPSFKNKLAHFAFRIQSFIHFFKQDPQRAISLHKDVVGVAGAVMLSIFAGILGIIYLIKPSKKPAAPAKTQKKEEESKSEDSNDTPKSKE